MQLDFTLELKSVDEVGVFEGFASTYGNRDHVKDVILPSAFAKSLVKMNYECPVLWAHDMAQPIGLGKLTDSDKGLAIRGELDLDVQAGRDAHSRLRKRYVKGLSVGFVPPLPDAYTYKDGGRHFKEIELVEVSLVVAPCNPEARITSVKSIDGPLAFEKQLHELGWSKSQAKRLARSGWPGLALPEEEPEEDYGELLALLRGWNKAA